MREKARRRITKDKIIPRAKVTFVFFNKLFNHFFLSCAKILFIIFMTHILT